MPAFTIVQATRDDLEQVHAINQGALPQVGSVSLEFLRWSLEAGPWFGVARAQGDGGGAVLGFCTVLGTGLDYESLNYRWFSARYDAFAYIDRIAVLPEARGMGVGSALYRAAFADLAGTAPRIACEVNIRPLNQLSLDFHRKLGFEIVGQQDTCEGEKTVAMHLREL